MHDHNLDDLIIDNIEPKNSKTKSFLTIIALLIVILIVAIILTKIILKDSNENTLMLEENDTEMISPELTLQNDIKNPLDTEETVLSNIEKSNTKIAVSAPLPRPEPKKVHTIKKEVAKRIVPSTVTISQEFSHESPVKPITKKIPERKRPKKVAPQKVAPKTPKTTAKQIYYIQVGSFKKTPSSRFLSVITNSGFSYKISSSSASGTKKLLIGPYTNKASVYSALVHVKDRINKSAFVVKK